MPLENFGSILNFAEELELRSDEWGGNTLVVPVSARAQTGIEDLLDHADAVRMGLLAQSNPVANCHDLVLMAELARQAGKPCGSLGPDLEAAAMLGGDARRNEMFAARGLLLEEWAKAQDGQIVHEEPPNARWCVGRTHRAHQTPPAGRQQRCSGMLGWRKLATR